MIIKLKDTLNFRSFLDTQNGDVTMQFADGASGFMCGSMTWYWKVVVRGMKPSEMPKYPVSDLRKFFSRKPNETLRCCARHINHKRQVVRFLRQYSQKEAETLSEAKLDGILRDFANADVRDPDGKRSWEVKDG